MKNSAKLSLSIVGVILVIVLISAASLGWRYYTAEVKGVVDAKEQIESANNRIEKYEEFFGICASVQTLKHGIETQERLLTASTSDSMSERVMTNISGMEAQLARQVNAYNAKSQMYTRKKFKASNLPARLSLTGPTYCE